MANLYLFKYNNYHNKILKVQQTIDGYGDPLSVTQSTNFNPNDGITTQHVVNTDFSVIPDYCVVMSDYGEIESRWFVMSCKRIRKGQWRVELLRDSLAEYRSQVLEAVCFIEKGYVNNANPLVFNNENMGFNQIKSGEYPLENNLKTPWLVLYLSRYHHDDNNNYTYNQFKGDFIDEIGKSDFPTYNELSEYPYYEYSKSSYRYIEDSQLVFTSLIRDGWTPALRRIFELRLSNDGFYYVYGDERTSNYPISYEKPNIDYTQAIQNRNNILDVYHRGDSLSGLQINSYSGLGTQVGAAILTSEQGKVIKVSNKYYRISSISGSIYNRNNSINAVGALYDSIKNNLTSIISEVKSTDELAQKVEWPYTCPTVKLLIEEISNQASIHYDFTFEGGYTIDAPYEIIAAPLYNTTFTIEGIPWTHSGRIANQWFQDIINRYNSAGYAYDLQIVPYVPDVLDQIIIDNSKVYYQCYTGSSSEGKIKLAIAFRVPMATFSLIYSIPSGLQIDLSNKKLDNEVNLYRLVSPNGIGEYEFSPYKNDGFEGVEVDCTLIPYNPYIKVNPIFSGLYGADYNDYRGLICKGDFSLPILSSAWETYQLQNKYYQDIFNRQISHQEYNNKFALASDILGATAGAVSAGVEGFTIGGGVGAAVSAGVSLLGGAADVVTNQMLRNEEIRYQKDMFGMQLGTIKAQSLTLSRTTSFNSNNKYFPYIEYYTCTEVEKEALKKKMEYNGMTVGVIGKISNYLSPTYEYTYVQAQLIEIDIPDDYQMVEEIARRLRGGIRIA